VTTREGTSSEDVSAMRGQYEQAIAELQKQWQTERDHMARQIETLTLKEVCIAWPLSVLVHAVPMGRLYLALPGPRSLPAQQDMMLELDSLRRQAGGTGGGFDFSHQVSALRSELLAAREAMVRWLAFVILFLPI
jgi:hypothetical protein